MYIQGGAEVTGQYRRHFKREAASCLRHSVYFQAEGNRQHTANQERNDQCGNSTA